MRFVKKDKQNNRFRLPALIGGLVLVLGLFVCGLNFIGESAGKAAKDTLEQAVAQDVTYCYAMEGSYPESIEYLEENYGLTYDKDRFYIGYRLQGSNIKPAVTVIEIK